jgi:RimJ/RimL family protein N-acetyltransferase
MKIKCNGFMLRPWKDSDVETLPRHASNRKIADQLRDIFPYPYSREDAVRWIEMVRPQNNPVKFFAIEVEGEAAGSIAIIRDSCIYSVLLDDWIAG